MTAELGLAVIATVDLCITYGKKLAEVRRTIKGADKEVTERLLYVENHLLRTRQQLDFLKQVSETLNEDFQELQNQNLKVLARKLDAALSTLERVVRKSEKGDSEGEKSSVHRLKYVFLKESLDKSIQEMEVWQKIFDPSWYLMMKISNPVIDQELQKADTSTKSLSTAKRLREAIKDEPESKVSIFLPEDGLGSSERNMIPYSEARLVQRGGAGKSYLLDSVPCDSGVQIELVTQDVRDLARKLTQADPTAFSLLKCRGVIRILDDETKKIRSFDFVFRQPEGMTKPQSLRSLLILADTSHSLSDRFRVAKQLAKSVHFVHNYGFVHKNIRPETVLNFEHEDKKIGSTFLLGFERFRLAGGQTRQLGDADWDKNLYRHPERQGIEPEETYKMQHDIYSLGVCLLEIGIWKSFVAYEETKPVPSELALLSAPNNIENEEGTRAAAIKNAMVSFAKDQLPRKMGDKYTDIVVTCLTCLDKDNVDFGDEKEFEDDDGVLVAVRYMEKVLLKLEEIII